MSERKRKPEDEDEDDGQPYVKKPPNAYMLFSKEQRPKLAAAMKGSGSAGVSMMLGEKWNSMSSEEQAKYYGEAHREKLLHDQQHPDWSFNDNCGRKKKRKRNRSKASKTEEYEEVTSPVGAVASCTQSAVMKPSTWMDSNLLARNKDTSMDEQLEICYTPAQQPQPLIPTLQWGKGSSQPGAPTSLDKQLEICYTPAQQPQPLIPTRQWGIGSSQPGAPTSLDKQLEICYTPVPQPQPLIPTRQWGIGSCQPGAPTPWDSRTAPDEYQRAGCSFWPGVGDPPMAEEFSLGEMVASPPSMTHPQQPIPVVAESLTTEREHFAGVEDLMEPHQVYEADENLITDPALLALLDDVIASLPDLLDSPLSFLESEIQPSEWMDSPAALDDNNRASSNDLA